MEDKQNYKKTKLDPCRCISYIAIIMGEKIAHFNWKRDQYSDIFLSSLADPSLLHEGQKVKVLWGTKTKKELTAVESLYPIVQKEVTTTAEVQYK